MACVNKVKSWTTATLHLYSQETDLLIKVIMKCVNIKLWDLLGCFHYILNAPRTLGFLATRPITHISVTACFNTLASIFMTCATFARVGISGTSAKSRKRKFVPSTYPEPFAIVALSRKKTNKGRYSRVF